MYCNLNTNYYFFLFYLCIIDPFICEKNVKLQNTNSLSIVQHAHKNGNQDIATEHTETR